MYEILVYRDSTARGIPYLELIISFSDGLEISVRRYPKNTFVGYSDDSGNWSSGADLEECWLAPTYIYKKTPNGSFSIVSVVKGLADELGIPLDEEILLAASSKWSELLAG